MPLGLIFSQVNPILLVIVAEAFEDVGVGQQVVGHLDGKRPGVHLGVVESRLDIQVAEVAAMVAWLASEDNSFTTGAVFDLSGGRATY